MCPENIMLYGVNNRFINHVRTNRHISVSVCMKHVPLNDDSVNDDSVNRFGPMLHFGILIYYCFIGTYPCPINININNVEIGSCLWAIINGKLFQYLGMHNKLKFVN
eukprot:714967_1